MGSSISAPATRPTRCARFTPFSPVRLATSRSRPGETSNASISWSNPALGAYNPSGLVHGDFYYSLLDRGLLICHDAKTGKEVYSRQRITEEAASFTASPWAYNGRIFAMSEEGDTYVIQAGSGVQAAREELARRDDARDAGDRQRQPDRADGLEAVSNRQGWLVEQVGRADRGVQYTARCCTFSFVARRNRSSTSPLRRRSGARRTRRPRARA